ncbi:hypothetical protein SAMN04487884_1518 [Butyrivibrio fibrisolvens]|uniref:Uncharacterized protein n=2 Tax=Butyrivibrio fibrisolvens TaxID=831 RepID=A0A1H9XA97_BUTFI|nr:hypothetical protein SAMN04487884_1518 [Butyrivibrio fibrisolvens]
MHEIIKKAIEREYGILYDKWPSRAKTNYVDAVYMLDLRTPRVIQQIFLIYVLFNNQEQEVYGLDDIITACRLIIRQDYEVGSIEFDPDLIGIVLRRAILAEQSGLMLLPGYRGYGYWHINCVAIRNHHRDYSSHEMPLSPVI